MTRFAKALLIAFAWPAGILAIVCALVWFDDFMRSRFGSVPIYLWIPCLAFWLGVYLRYCWRAAKGKGETKPPDGWPCKCGHGRYSCVPECPCQVYEPKGEPG